MTALPHTPVPNPRGVESLDGIIPAAESWWLAQTLRGTRVHVVADETTAHDLAAAVAAWCPQALVQVFVGWDCLPYDRSSPSRVVMGERLGILTSLLQPSTQPRLLLVPAPTLLQRLPPPDVLAQASFVIKAQAPLNRAALESFLQHAGYWRTSTVRAAGEYSLRGGIVDIFAASAEQPVRLDLFGDEIESLRYFDAATQVSTTPCEQYTLLPVSEVLLTPDRISRFRQQYRACFGAQGDTDSIYTGVSAGSLVKGVEHYLPLFYERSATLLDYTTKASWSLAADVGSAMNSAYERVLSFYNARQQPASHHSPAYRALPPEYLYVPAAEILGNLPTLYTQLTHDTNTATTRLITKPLLGLESVRATNPAGVLAQLAVEITKAAEAGATLLLTAETNGSLERLQRLLREHQITPPPLIHLPEVLTAKGGAYMALSPLRRGFMTPTLWVITESDLFGERVGGRARKSSAVELFNELAQWLPNDLVVHRDHGIGRFIALETVTVDGSAHDCLRIQYASDGRLLVPVENADVISRYGSDDAGVMLDTLGGAAWQARKAAVKQKLMHLAGDLLRLAALRQTQSAPAINLPEAYADFCARFPHIETDDQMRAIEEVLHDLASGKPMDRLLCGDVGFGKTEVALRAAFAVSILGLQVVMIAPTTLLVRQHAANFRARFQGFPVRIAALSRLTPAKEAASIRAAMAAGQVDIVIGTHSLLSAQNSFATLGLIIVDEEQHFGVKQKERLKQLQTNAHLLTLSATPIPRTLQLALFGVRDLSLIATPPVDRLAIKTQVLTVDPLAIRDALMREKFRGGQSFYVCPRIADLATVYDELATLVPELRVAIAHGQMPASDLEQVMTKFVDGTIDVLLATNIIESGLDMPRANTIIIHRADRFGLGQLYQLRGRVGRSKQQAYCLLTLPAGHDLTDTAQQRLDIMRHLNYLGAGFQLASHDLDLRGAGNLLGEEQSGQVREVGIELYQQLLEQELLKLKADSSSPLADGEWTPEITMGVPVLLPETYIPDLALRLQLYRRIASLRDDEAASNLRAELLDRFGSLPEEAQTLLDLVALKRQCLALNIGRCEAGPKGLVLGFRHNNFAHPEALIHYLASQSGTAKIRPDNKVVFMRVWPTAAARINGTAQILSSLQKLR